MNEAVERLAEMIDQWDDYQFVTDVRENKKFMIAILRQLVKVLNDKS